MVEIPIALETSRDSERHYSTVYPVRSLSTGHWQQFSFPSPVYEVMARSLSPTQGLCVHISLSVVNLHIHRQHVRQSWVGKQLPSVSVWWQYWKTRKYPRLTSEYNCCVYLLASHFFLFLVGPSKINSMTFHHLEKHTSLEPEPQSFAYIHMHYSCRGWNL